MGLRSILLLPRINHDLVHDVRQQYDTLYQHVAPHISLVFPFESDMSDDTVIQVVMNVMQHFSAFDITLNRVAGEPDNGYVWLVVDQGAAIITAMHDALYQAPIFAAHLRQDIPYIPHMTIAQGVTPEQAQQLIAALGQTPLTIMTTIASVSVEHILINDDSDVFCQVALRCAHEN